MKLQEKLFKLAHKEGAKTIFIYETSNNWLYTIRKYFKEESSYEKEENHFDSLYNQIFGIPEEERAFVHCSDAHFDCNHGRKNGKHVVDAEDWSLLVCSNDTLKVCWESKKFRKSFSDSATTVFVEGLPVKKRNFILANMASYGAKVFLVDLNFNIKTVNFEENGDNVLAKKRPPPSKSENKLPPPSKRKPVSDVSKPPPSKRKPVSEPESDDQVPSKRGKIEDAVLDEEEECCEIVYRLYSGRLRNDIDENVRKCLSEFNIFKRISLALDAESHRNFLSAFYEKNVKPKEIRPVQSSLPFKVGDSVYNENRDLNEPEDCRDLYTITKISQLEGETIYLLYDHDYDGVCGYYYGDEITCDPAKLLEPVVRNGIKKGDIVFVHNDDKELERYFYAGIAEGDDGKPYYCLRGVLNSVNGAQRFCSKREDFDLAKETEDEIVESWKKSHGGSHL